MTPEEFDARVQRLEAQSKRSPGLYRFRVFCLALVGYAYIGSVLLLLLGLVGLSVLAVASGHGVALFAKVGWLVAVLVWTTVRSLWVRIPAPEGTRLDRRTAPSLWEGVEAIRKPMRAPRPHVVLLTDDFNAAVVQVPRLGVLGWQKNYLLLGLPLLLAMPLRELQAVVAHEFGHLAGAHGRFGGWIYRQRMGWARLLERLEVERSWGNFLFRRFAEWYAPFFNAYTFVQARAQEYEADREAASIAGPTYTASALVRLEVASGVLGERFWPSVQGAVRTQPAPPPDVFQRMARALEAPVEDADAQALLDRALARETTSSDTHPCLRARLAALDAKAQLPAPFQQSAAEALLGDALPALAKLLGDRWRTGVAGAWKEGHQQALAQRKRLADLESRRARERLETGEEWEWACLLSAEGRSQEANAVLEQLASDAPDFAPAQQAWGQLLLARGDEAGLGHVDRALDLCAEGGLSACQAAYAFLAERGRESEAQRYVERARNYQATVEAAQLERQSYTLGDPLEPHGLEEVTLAPLREQLARLPQVGAAFLVRKRVRLLPEHPVWVLGVRARRNLSGTDALQEKLAKVLEFPGDFFVFVFGRGQAKRRVEEFERVAGGAFYERTG